MNQARIIDEHGVGEWQDADKVYATAKHGALVEDDASVPIGDTPGNAVVRIDWGEDLDDHGKALTDAVMMAFGLAAFRALPSFEEAHRAVWRLIAEVDEALPTYGREPAPPGSIAWARELGES
jgi:hypothetical protein